MNNNHFTIGELLGHLLVQESLSPEEVDNITENLQKQKQTPEEPIYLLLLYGIGAWFSAGSLILFLDAADLLNESSALIIIGLFFLIGAIAIHLNTKATFFQQLSHTLVISGNLLVVNGAARAFQGEDILVFLVAQTIVCAVIYPLYDNRIYRYWAPLSIALLATLSIVELKMHSLIHILIAIEILLTGLLLLWKKSPPAFVPLVYSVATMLPATLLLIYFIQANMRRSHFNEPLGVSSLLLAGGLVFLYIHLAQRGWFDSHNQTENDSFIIKGVKKLQEPWMILAIVATMLLGIFTTPGILVIIGLLVIGYALDDQILIVTSAIFLPCFLILFYNTVHLDLADKSWVLIGSGVVLLVTRLIAGYYQPEEVTS